MPTVTITDLSEEAFRALEARARRNGHSLEAEMCAILEAAVLPAGRVRIGSALAALSREVGLTNADVEALERSQTSRTPS